MQRRSEENNWINYGTVKIVPMKNNLKVFDEKWCSMNENKNDYQKFAHELFNRAAFKFTE